MTKWIRVLLGSSSFAFALFTSLPLAEAQIRPLQRLRDRMEERRNWNSSGTMEASQPEMSDSVVLRRQSGVVVNTTPNSPYEIPTFAEGFQRRIRIVDGNGNFYNRYYGENGKIAGTNWQGPPELGTRARQELWNSYNRPEAPTQYSSRSSSSGSSRNTSSSASSRYNSFQSNANSLNNSINARSQAYRASSMNSLNNFGSQIRNSMNGGSGSASSESLFMRDDPK